jgi:hypothetical protein
MITMRSVFAIPRILHDPHCYPALATSKEREQERLRQLEVIGGKPIPVPQSVIDELKRYFENKRRLQEARKDKDPPG